MSEFDANPANAYDYRLWDAARELQDDINKAIERVAKTHDVGQRDVLMVYEAEILDEDLSAAHQREEER